MEVDAARNRVLVPQTSGRVVAVDLDSGQRTMFAAGSGGEFIDSPTDIAIDVGMNRVIVLDYQRHGLAAVDLDDGEAQSVLSSNNAVSGGVGFVEPFGVALDVPNARMLVSDIGLRRVVSLDLATAIGSVAVDGDTGTPLFAGPRALALDSAANRLFILEQGSWLPPAVIAVDLASGDRSVLSGPAQPNGVLPLTAPQQMALDARGMRLLVTERDERAVKAIDVASGSRTIVSSDSVPNASNAFTEPSGIVVDSGNDRAFVANSPCGPDPKVLAINLATGERSVVAANTTGQLTGPKLLALDTARNRLLVVDGLRQTMFAVDLTSGVIGSLTDVDDPDNPIDSPNGLAYDPATQIAYIAEWNFAAILAVDLVTGRRAFLSH
jgi:DNA-binding beta-propeller fold protein YncE